METVIIHGECFIATDAKLFAEPGRPIEIHEGSFIGSDAVLHGPIVIGKHTGINHHCHFDGGKKGIHIGEHCRIAAYCSLIAFNHRFDRNMRIDEQNVSSEGITLGNDVWLGTHVGITDGVTIDHGAVVGMRSVVTKNVDSMTVVAGNPAKYIKSRI